MSSMCKDFSNDAVLGVKLNQLKALCTVPIPQHLTKEHQILDNELYLGKGSKDPAS